MAAESEQMLKDAGYQQFDPKKTYAPGDKVYFSQLGKAIVALRFLRAPVWVQVLFLHRLCWGQSLIFAG